MNAPEGSRTGTAPQPLSGSNAKVDTVEKAAAQTLPAPIPALARPSSSTQVTPVPTTADSTPSKHGQPFGDYELLQELGKGGMGVVWKAYQQSLRRTVALKMIRTGQLTNPADVERFRREAQSLAQLDHPNIVPVYEYGEILGEHYIAMAFIEGPTLAVLVREKGLLPWDQAAELLAQVAEAIHHAHKQGIIHRDLKPENILIDVNGRPRVTDFGVAKRHLLPGGEANGEVEPELTMQGQPVGTAPYMSPEQALGQSNLIAPPTDVYGLGGILYFLLTGRPPFPTASNAYEILTRVLKEAPIPPRQLNPNVPIGLEKICLRCLTKDLTQRYQTADDVRTALLKWLREFPEETPVCGTLIRNSFPREPDRNSSPDEPVPAAFPNREWSGPVPDPKTSANPWSIRWLVGLCAGLSVALVTLVVLLIVLHKPGSPGGTDGSTVGKYRKEKSPGEDTKRPLEDVGKSPPDDVGRKPPDDVDRRPPGWKLNPLMGRLKALQPREDFPVQVAVPNHPRDGQGDSWRLEFTEGEYLRFTITPQQTCWVRIWWVRPEGKAVQIFPNRFDRHNNKMEAGKTFSLPTDSKFRMIRSQGEEMILVLASTREWTAGEAQLCDGLLLVEQEQVEKERGIVVEEKSASVYEERIPFIVKPKTGP